MANVYVYSGAAGGGTGADWANAYTTLAAALAAKAAGDTFFVADDHAETQGSTMTLTSPGTSASPCRILCALRTGGSVPPVSADLRTTATVTTTGAFAIGGFGGVAYVYGITFSGGSGTSGGNYLNFNAASVNAAWVLDTCALKTANTSASTRFVLGHTSGSGHRDYLLRLRNTTMEFANASQTWNLTSGRLRWEYGGSFTGTVPTIPFTLVQGGPLGTVDIRGVDLSAVASGKTLFGGTAGDYAEINVVDCRLGAAVAVSAITFGGFGGPQVRVVNCDSADTNYRYHRQNYQGTITQETTIVRTGGASDGTTPVSRKMVTTANSKLYGPLESDPIIYWNETLSSQTATVEVVTDGVTLTDAEAWVEAEYLGTSGVPLALSASDRAADILAGGSNQTSSSETWTTTGLSSPTRQKLAVTFTPAEKGPVRLRVMLAKASTTMYCCPKADIT